MSDFSLADLKQVITEKYKPLIVDIGEGREVRLVQVAVLPDAKQDELIAMQKQFKALQEEGAALRGAAADVTPEQVAEWKATLDHEPTPDEVQEFKTSSAQTSVSRDDVKAFKARAVAVLEDMLRIVVETTDQADQLIEACNHEQLILMELFTRYSRTTQLGEASASSSSSESTAGHSSATSGSTTDSTSGQ